jgi:hypothetical protein
VFPQVGEDKDRGSRVGKSEELDALEKPVEIKSWEKWSEIHE